MQLRALAGQFTNTIGGGNFNGNIDLRRTSSKHLANQQGSLRRRRSIGHRVVELDVKQRRPEITGYA